MNIQVNNIKQNKNTEIEKTKKAKNKRCNFEGCRKRLGLLNHECKCGNTYCEKHILSNSHNCTYDYKKYYLDDLKKNNISVKFNKIEKI